MEESKICCCPALRRATKRRANLYRTWWSKSPVNAAPTTPTRAQARLSQVRGSRVMRMNRYANDAPALDGADGDVVKSADRCHRWSVNSPSRQDKRSSTLHAEKRSIRAGSATRVTSASYLYQPETRPAFWRTPTVRVLFFLNCPSTCRPAPCPPRLSALEHWRDSSSPMNPSSRTPSYRDPRLSQ
jgi:hypothetical protein